MIALATESGNLLRVFPERGSVRVGYHPQFGFIETSTFKSRKRLRKTRGLRTRDEWLCQFTLSGTGDSWAINEAANCQAQPAPDQRWALSTQFGNFWLGQPEAFSAWETPALPEEESKLPWKVPSAILAVFFLVMFAWPKGATVPEEEKVAELEEPITVTVMRPHNTVAITTPGAANVKTLTEEQVRNNQKQKAIAQNLGFLKTFGRPDLKGAIGGMPTNFKNVTAGAGPGGSGGSGGELLVGLGKGLKRVTVGNTGVAGLGGVRTAQGGAGGGAGGYGETLVASGSGRLSGMPVAGDITLEGGLDRAVVQATIAKYLSQVRACYEDGLTKRPGIQGQVTTSFEINGGGALNFAKVVQTSLGDAAVERCITQRMMTWQFPKPRGGVNVAVKYPFLLRPVNVGE